MRKTLDTKYSGLDIEAKQLVVNSGLRRLDISRKMGWGYWKLNSYVNGYTEPSPDDIDAIKKAILELGGKVQKKQ